MRLSDTSSLVESLFCVLVTCITLAVGTDAKERLRMTTVSEDQPANSQEPLSYEKVFSTVTGHTDSPVKDLVDPF